MSNKQRLVHLVGSIPLADAESVFENVGRILKGSVKRIPDGETGTRNNWIAWQLPLLETNPNLEPDPDAGKPTGQSAEDGLAVDKRSFRFLRVKPGTDATNLDLQTEYARHATESFRKFDELQAAGKIPAGVRFQVSLPTPYAVASLYVSPASWSAFLPAYERAILRDLEIIMTSIPHAKLAIQWDVCMEVIAWERQVRSPEDDLERFTFDSISRLCDAVPETIDVGIHLCYGDPGHKHIVEPKDMKILVAMASGISAATARSLNWIHMPVPKERDDVAYFAALADLELDTGCELYLGLVHFTDQDEGAAKRIRSACTVVQDFGIATECGFGRRPPTTVIPLLELHQRCATATAPGEHESG
ncbi:MAG: hypothetical protein P8X59_03155 [Woeseiaceae bacterium]|jgi:methionine synthase II (cobalamin-independent)